MSEATPATTPTATTTLETTNTTEVTNTVEPTTTPGPTEVPASWVDSLPDELKGYVQNKGFKDPSAVVESYRNFEKIHGVPEDKIIKLPKSQEEKEAWDKIYTKLGRPEKPEEYGLAPKEEGAEYDKEFVGWAEKTFHELGLNRNQAMQLMAKYNEHLGGRVNQTEEQKQAQTEAEADQLKKQWGEAYEQELAKAKNAARTFGLEAETLEKLESVLGFKGTISLFNKIGNGLGEATFHNGEAAGFAGKQTPTQARDKISTLMQDQEFIKRYASGEYDAKQEMERLHKAAYGYDS